MSKKATDDAPGVPVLALWEQALSDEELRRELVDEDWTHQPSKKKNCASKGKWRFERDAWFIAFRDFASRVANDSAYGTRRKVIAIPQS